ncbi:PLP-dependent aminotransferase family protein [Aliigemmobacter aestuarii]|uniref:PLP-dependent aminotransferase family protein n=1 Tax=Aliigemmobacter aestuarii TaxID=1445661 RepID=A0A4S3ML58_9RHOB|nr:PLP-dependent aminotransferase family protein [Gemmobacter aestuarii]THD82934.1 PLP-dependent aminotransferase family protein [Gemmobacter aestuarii]
MAVPVESFFLTPGATGTLQQQIRQMVTEGILSGRLRPGDRMPSSRGLANHLGISRITVTLAYTDLVASDYLTSRGRSGYFVSSEAPTAPELEVPARGAGQGYDYDRITGRRWSRLARVARPEDWQRYPYPFIYGQADATLFDHQNWRACALRALGKRDFEALTSDYYDSDDPLLIEYILRNILPRRGIAARPGEVLLTLGAQNALWLAAQVLLGPGRRAVVENPGYTSLRGILEQADGTVVPVDVDDAGLPPEALPQAADVVFVTPSHHCPTNATMPLARRQALLAAARERDFVIVEDDYEFEMSFLRTVSPSLKSLDAEGRVIYIGSFSKSLFPGLRLGYLVGPESFIREARALRADVLRHPPGHVQRTAAYFLSLGHYDAMINRMKAAYRRRRTVMEEAIAEHGLTVAGQGGFGGSSFWMRAPDHVDTGELALRLRAKGVLIEPGQVFFAREGAPRNYYRLAYSSIPQGRIPDGIRLIAEGIAATGHKPVA